MLQTLGNIILVVITGYLVYWVVKLEAMKKGDMP